MAIQQLSPFMHEEFEHLVRRWRPALAKCRPKAATRVRVGEIVAQTKWLGCPLIYWAGPDSAQTPSTVECRPLAHVIRDKLLVRPPGLYALMADPISSCSDRKKRALAAPPIFFPAVKELVPVDASLLATTSYQAFVASRRYPQALPELVNDIDHWRNGVATRLGLVRSALEACRLPGMSRPEHLALEDVCLWFGRPDRRPSRLLKTETLFCWLKKHGRTPAQGQALAAVILGQRGEGAIVPPEVTAWKSLGAQLSNWPPDLIACLSTMDRDRVLKLAQRCPLLNLSEAWQAFLDYRLASWQSPLFPFLEDLLPVLASLQQQSVEHARRWGKFAYHLGVVLDRAPMANYSFSVKEVLGETGEDRGLETPSVWTVLDTVDALCRWFLGRGFPPELAELLSARIDNIGLRFRCPGLRSRLNHWPPAIPEESQEVVWSACRVAVMDAIVALREEPVLERTDVEFVAALAGRIAACGESRRTLGHLAAWLDHCRDMWASPKEGGALRLACEAIWVGAKSWRSPADRERFLETLSLHGFTLLRREIAICMRQHGEPFPCDLTQTVIWQRLNCTLAVLGNLGSLTTAHAVQIVRGDLFDFAAPFLPAKSEALPGFLDWLHVNPNAKRPFWVGVFLLHSSALVSLLTRWLQRMIDRHGFPWQCAEQILEHLVDDFLDTHDHETRYRQTFLLSTFWIVERILPKGAPFGESAVAIFAQRLQVIEIAYRWNRSGYADQNGLIEALLVFCIRQEEQEHAPSPWSRQLLSDKELGLVVELSGGHVDRLLALLAHLVPNWERCENPEVGWRFLARWPSVRDFLGSCTTRAKELPRVIHLLKRLALISRLPVHDFVCKRMQLWENPSVKHSLPPAGVAQAFVEKIGELTAYRRMAGRAKAYPDAIEKVLNRGAALENERTELLRLETERKLTDSARIRLEKLEKLRTNPAHLSAWIERDLSRLIEGHLHLARLETLEMVTRAAIRRHWETILDPVPDNFDSSDWDNAMRLWQTVKTNRQLLKELLQNEACNNRHWVKDRPPNRDFVENMRQRGICLDAWLGPTQRTYSIRRERWTVRVETEPLKVLWMGRLFGTCLSPGDVNAFSTIPNAAEINKRVLYLHDAKGTIRGRKLLAMSKEGVVFGFSSYGSIGPEESDFSSTWIKLLFDQFALELVQKTGARFPTGDEETNRKDDDTERFKLCATWYFDGYEPFDGWVKQQAVHRQPSIGLMRQAVLDGLTTTLHEKRADFGKDCGETMRALLWLGDADIVREAESYGALVPEQRAYLTEYLEGRALECANV